MGRPIKIRETSLKRQKVLGFADFTSREISIDTKAHNSQKELLDTICHEVLHISSNDMLSEKAVNKLAHDLSDVLYRMKWRRIARGA